jgi:hypothetical protein
MKALGPGQWSVLRSQADAFLSKIVINVTPFSGLTANAVAHLRENWIEWGDEFVIIRVPADADCNSWMLGGSANGIPSISERDEPCTYCQENGTTESFENLWNGEDSSGGRGYKATLHRDIAEPAIEFLDEVFHNWGRNGIYAAPGSVAEAAERLVEDEDRSRYSKLLRTGVALYCHYGLNIANIADLTPYTELTIEDILSATPEVTYKKNNSYTYLRAVAKNEPTSVQVLAQELGVTAGAVWQTLNQLKKRNRVAVDKDGRPHEWSIVGDWTAPFVCDICGYQSPTLRGIQSHKQTHDE